MSLFIVFLWLPLLFLLIQLLFYKSSIRYLPFLNTLLCLILLALLLLLYQYLSQEVLQASLIAPMPVDISFKLDQLNWLICLFCILVWLASSLYSIYFMKADSLNKVKRYQIFSTLNLYAILLIFLSSNMITFFIFFELLLIVSYVLIIHYQTQESFAAGIRYLFFQIIGGLMLLFAVILTYTVLETTEFVPGGYEQLTSNPFFSLIFWFFVIGFSIKAGLFPVHIWLPEAHPAAPAPASALLSGMVIKTGTFGIMRVFLELFGIQNIIGRTDIFILIFLSIFTMFWGSAIAIGQGHIKRILAYSSVSQMGYIVLGTAFLSPFALLGSLLHTLGHSLVKSLLFLSAGSIVNDTGKADISSIDGYGYKNPFVFTVFTIGALSIIGFPLFINFISKWTLGVGFMEAYQLNYFPFWLFIIALSVLLLSSILNATYYVPILIRGWFYPSRDHSIPIKLKTPQIFSLAMLAVLIVSLGIFAQPLIEISMQALSAVIPFAYYTSPF